MPFLSAHKLKRTFASRRRGAEPVVAVDDVSLCIDRGQTLGLVGESGSGKSTLGRLISRLIEPDEGSVVLDGVDLTRLKGHKLRLARSEFQVVFQEPFASLNPRMAVEQIVEEPLLATGLERSRSKRRDRVAAILEEVGLPSEFLDRRPADLSGGQQQRVGIARALVSDPKLVILDEPTSSLDQTVRAGILSLLAGLQQTHGLTFVFISHDIHTVRRLCDRTAVMHLGRIVEIGDTEDVLDRPQHPYTRKLLSAALSLIPGRDGPGFSPGDEEKNAGTPSGMGRERSNSIDRDPITATGGHL